MNKSACLYRSWLWHVEAIWVFTTVGWNAADPACAGSLAIPREFFVQTWKYRLWKVSLLLCSWGTSVTKTQHMEGSMHPQPSLDLSDLCKQGGGPWNVAGPLEHNWLHKGTGLDPSKGTSLLPRSSSHTTEFACRPNPYFLVSVVTL